MLCSHELRKGQYIIMRIENEKALAGEKIFLVDEIGCMFPHKVDEKLLNWGVLEVYKDKWFSLDEINDLIAELFKMKPYMQGAMNIEIAIGWKVAETHGYHTILNFKNYYYETEKADDKVELKYQNAKKMYVLNEDGVAEYIAATDKEEALRFAGSLWGQNIVDEHFEDYMDENPDSNHDEFVEDFVREMPEDNEFSLYSDGDGKTTTKTIKEFLKDITEVPSYFACSEY